VAGPGSEVADADVIAIADRARHDDGCFTSWTLTQVTGTERAWDEKVQEASVPACPASRKRLVVTIPLDIEYEAPRARRRRPPPPPARARAATAPAVRARVVRAEQRAR